MEKMLALYGSGQGPRIPIKGKRCFAVVEGRVQGPVRYTVETDGVESHVELSATGEVPLPSGDFVRVEYTGSKLGVLCFVRA